MEWLLSGEQHFAIRVMTFSIPSTRILFVDGDSVILFFLVLALVLGCKGDSEFHPVTELGSSANHLRTSSL